MDGIARVAQSRTLDGDRSGDRLSHPQDESGAPGDPDELIDLVRDAIHERSHGDDTIKLWTVGAEALYGWSKAEAIGRAAHELLRTQFPRPLADIEKEIARTGRWQGELVHTRRDGQQVVVASRWSLRRDGLGRPRAYLVVETDLSESHLAADAQGQLRRERYARQVAEEATERLRRFHTLMLALAGQDTPLDVARTLVERGLHVLGASAGGVLVLRQDGQALENLAAVGYPRDLLAAWQCIPLAAPMPVAEAARTCQPIWVRSVASATRYPQLKEALDRISSHAMAALPLLVGSRAIGTLVLTFEEERTFGTDERGLATLFATHVAALLDRALRFASIRAVGTQAIEALRQRDELLVSAGHDLKVPLTAIKMTAQLLSRRLATSHWPEARMVIEELRRIDSALNRSGALIDEVVALTEPEIERPARLARDTTDLVALVRQVVAEACPIELDSRVVVYADPPALVGQWDAAQLARVFANLLDNALKYSPPESMVQVRLSLETAPEGRSAVVRIEDEGLGIPEPDLARVFKRFQRGANVVGLVPGMGVGLASVREIVEQHGGSVDVDSQVGRSSTFTVRLPLLATAPYLAES